MSERRQAFQAEPIEIDLGNNQVISISPIPWEARNAWGNEVVAQNVKVINDSVKMYIDSTTGLPELEARLTEKYDDPVKLLRMGLSEAEFSKLSPDKLFKNQLTAIFLAIAEVNELEQLYPMLDPNSTTPTELGGIVSGLLPLVDDTPLTESGPDSLSPESPETPSETLPTPSLLESSTN